MTLYALSAQQRRAWLRDAALRLSVCRFRLSEPRTAEDVRAAARSVVERHPLLRAEVRRAGGRRIPLLELGGGTALAVECAGDTIELRTSTLHCDAVSLVRLAAEIEQALRGEVLPQAPDYLQFARWQDEILATADDAEREDWRSARAALTGCVAPTLAPAPRVATIPRWRTMPLPLGEETVAQLFDAAMRLDTSPKLLALACWSSIIARNRDRDEIALGVTCPGRGYAPFRDIVGPIARTLPLVVAAADTPRLLVAQLRARLDELEEREETFDWGLDEQDVPRFAAGFRHVALHDVAPRIDSLLDADDAASLFCSLAEGAARFHIQLDFDSAVYDERALEPVGRQLQALLQQIARDCEAPIPRTILPEEDRRRIVAGFAIRPSGRSAAERFLQQVARDPERVALIDDARELTYAELCAWGAELAGRIRAHDTRNVALLFPPGAPMVAAMVGCLLAGKAYVPLDPADPPSRRDFILRDSGAELLLTAENVRGVDAYRPSELVTPGPDAPAYIIYTSGTTGRPKGVEIPSRALANYAAWAGETLAVTPDDRAALLTSAAYDLGYTALWGMLLNGATIYVPSDELLGDPPRLLGELLARGITFLKLTPSLLHLYLEADVPTHVWSSLRMVVVGGESIRPDDLQRLARLAGRLTIVNHYGPTEATIGCIANPILPGQLDEFCSQPVLGWPVTNAAICICDSAGSPVVRGVAGEICVGGEGLASGYPGDRALTAARFVTLDGLGRVYRTGDRGYQLPDGRTAFLGRADTQLKIRGHRVEPAEVARVLAAHEAIDDVAVCAIEGSAGESALVAFCVPAESRAGVVRRLCRRIAADTPQWLELPDGEPVLPLNVAEAMYQHREIFIEQAYLRNGISLSDGDVVIDVGANIGMFAVQAALRAAGVTIVAIEPASAAFQALQQNAALYGGSWRCIRAAAGAANGTAPLTVFRDHSLLATLRPEPAEDRELLFAMAEGRHGTLASAVRRQLQATIDEQMEAAEESCTVRTLSEIIREQGLTRVDLLKIDAQRAELDVLLGIRGEDWPRIRQIALETEPRFVETILELLRGHGYAVRSEPGEARILVHAIRRGERRASETAPMTEWRSPRKLVESLKRTAAEALAPHALPSRYLLVDRLPLNANGKLSAEALVASLARALEVSGQVTEPPTDLGKQLAALWRSALGVTDVGLESQFFELGGQSLIAARLTNAIREQLRARVTMAEVLRNARFRDLLELVESRLGPGMNEHDALLAPAPWGDVYPLSHLQRRLWFACQFDGASEAYNVSRAFRIRGEIDALLVQRALQSVVARHDALRTCFERREPVQRVRSAAECMPPLRAAAVPAGWSTKAALAWIDSETAQPFDLTRDVLLRAVLVRFADGQSLLILTTHHLVADGWSIELLLRDFFAAYASLRRGLPPFDTPPPRPHKDFIRLLDQLADDARAQSGAYLARWSQRPIAAAALPADFEPEQPSFHGLSVDVTLPESLAAATQRLAARFHVSPFSAYIAALDVLLHRWTRANDVVLAATVSGRELPEAAAQIGFFANTLLLHASVDGAVTWEELVRRVGASVVEALEHQHLGLDEIVSRVRTPRRRGVSTLASIGVTWYEIDQRAGLDLDGTCGFSCELVESERQGARADLWFFAEVSNAIQWRIIFNAALFRRERIEELAEELIRVVEEMNRCAGEPIAPGPAPSAWREADLDFELSL